MSFKDHFSKQSRAYSRYRPGYPPGLIAWVAAQAPDRRLALDCATGNGQAAIALADHFESVLALDGSLSQLRNAAAAPRVTYVAATAERLPVPDRSVSLVAAAQAAHWFDFERFHAECRRVLVPGGVVAAWTYEKFRVDVRSGRGDRPLLFRGGRALLAARAPLRGGGLPDAAVSVARRAASAVLARDLLGPRPGHGLPRDVVVGAALQGQSRSRSAAGAARQAARDLAFAASRGRCTGRSTCGWATAESSILRALPAVPTSTAGSRQIRSPATCAGPCRSPVFSRSPPMQVRQPTPARLPAPALFPASRRRHRSPE